MKQTTISDVLAHVRAELAELTSQHAPTEAILAVAKIAGYLEARQQIDQINALPLGQS